MPEYSIHVATTEAQLPPQVRSEIEQNGYSGRVGGVVSGNKVYFVASNIDSVNVEYTVMHELAGHYGLNKLLGNQLNQRA